MTQARPWLHVLPPILNLLEATGGLETPDEGGHLPPTWLEKTLGTTND